MILPTKHISVSRSFLGSGAIIIEQMNHSETITTLWNKVSTNPNFDSFEKFILTLDFLYMIGAIQIDEGLLRRCRL
jgi:hypothetical protein